MITKTLKWIGCHQLMSFFILTYVITWGLGFSYIAVMSGKYLVLPLMFLATCGPALAGIIVSSVSGLNRPKVKKRHSWVAFFISWIIVTGVFVANHILINKGPVSAALVVLVAISALPVAFVVNLVYTRFPVLQGFQMKSHRTGADPAWIFFALLVFPSLTLISALISRLLGPESSSFYSLPATGFGLAGLIVVKLLSQFFFFNGTGEEAGWRGFALPRLQAYTSPLVAGLILALFWVPWHLFLWIGEGRDVLTLSFWVTSFLLHIPSGVILCWCYNRSRGSVLIAGIAHASGNTAIALLQPLDQRVMILVFFVFVAAIVIIDQMWKRLPEEHPAVQKALN